MVLKDLFYRVCGWVLGRTHSFGCFEGLLVADFEGSVIGTFDGSFKELEVGCF